ncbi:hypothetical protein ACRXCV_09375 [Halobacteriovorax sp. GFR7]|uniref:hypothetical protein n=1 Tax=unclassified Halobacteriovorax TaxID=2639665 RepID=UPI003D962E76
MFTNIAIFTIATFLSFGVFAQENCTEVNNVTEAQVECALETAPNSLANSSASFAKVINLCRKYSLDIENIKCGLDISPANPSIGVELCLNYTQEQRECGKNLVFKNSNMTIVSAVKYCSNESQGSLDCATELSNSKSIWIPNSFKDNLKTCKKHSSETIDCAVATASIVSSEYGFDYNLMMCQKHDYETVNCVGQLFFQSTFGRLLALHFDVGALCETPGEKMTRCAVKYVEDNASTNDLLSTKSLKNILIKGYSECM